MAKVYESDVDADEFIRGFREEPSGISGLRKTQVATDETASDKTFVPTQIKTVPELSERGVAEITDDEDEAYRRRYLLDSTYMWPQEKFQPVEIDPEFVQKIRRIISYEKKRTCTVKAYVNNVLAAHFEQFAAMIEKRL